MRLDAGASASEREHIWSWVEEAPEHGIAFARAMAVWDRSGRLKSVYGSTLEDQKPQADELRKFIIGLE